MRALELVGVALVVSGAGVAWADDVRAPDTAVRAPDKMIAARVVEVGGGLAFLDVGAEGGVAAGMAVGFGGEEAGDPEDVGAVSRVVEVNAKTAAVTLAAGQEQAIVVGERASVRVHAIAAPTHPDGVGQWPELVAPAVSQHPAEVPMSEAAATEQRVHLAVIAHAFGARGQGEDHGESELRVIGAFELATEHPLGADLDVAARAYQPGYGNGREPLIVRAATLRYGDPLSPGLAIGRLHFAASTLGLLDGGRAALHAGRVEVAAFGGIVPDPISGKPDTSATRFGGEFVYDAADTEYRPRLSVEAHGSTWDGKLDERRLNLAGTAVIDRTWVDGWLEVQQFPDDATQPSGHAFDASAVEIVGGGASAEWRSRDAHVGGDLTYITPDRSLRIASQIPEWLCTRVPGTMPPQCTGDDRLVAATLSAGVRGERWGVDGAGTFAAAHGQATGVGGSGYLRGEYRPTAETAVHVTGSGGRADFADWGAAEVGVAVVPTPRFDIGLAYRPEWLGETAAADAVVLHSILLDTRWAIAPQLDLGLFAMDTIGGGQGVLAGLLTIAWRPL